MMFRPYSPEKFEDLVKEFEEEEAKILLHKRSEYSDKEDRLQNFHQQAIIQGVEPAGIALTYLLKHILSIAKAVSVGNQPWVWTTKEGHEGLKQRFADARNYLLLLAACVDEEEGWA
jgi:hypothetical protein